MDLERDDRDLEQEVDDLKERLEKMENLLKGEKRTFEREHIPVKMARVSPSANLPKRTSDGAAGYDVYANLQEPVSIPPGTNAKIGIGVALEIPEGYWVAVCARSGLALKEGLRPANCVGVGDEDFRDEYSIAIYNDSDCTRVVEPNERIAQILFLKYSVADFELATMDELSKTKRGTRGWGGSGK